MWSFKETPNNFPASIIRLVVIISSLLGVGSPLGWLWSKRIETPFFRKAERKISLGSAIEVLIVPTDNNSSANTRFLLSKISKSKHCFCLYFKTTGELNEERISHKEK